jgi:eukaryotic translation initiation factor 2C
MNQNNREESIAGVRSMITDIVNIYKKNTNTYPVRVMYFRDGVAEGQFAKVKEMEVTAIKDAIAALSGHVPTVTAIVVRKRNHTRLFPKENEGDRGSRGNVHPGTVVDQEITHPRDFDFCMDTFVMRLMVDLVPHSSIQGTARPAHYCISL